MLHESSVLVVTTGDLLSAGRISHFTQNHCTKPTTYIDNIHLFLKSLLVVFRPQALQARPQTRL